MEERFAGFVAASGGASRRLVVLLHASGRTVADMAPLAALAREEMPDADTWAPPLPIERLLSRSRAANIATKLVAGLDRQIAEREARNGGAGYESILLVGHSYGAVLARAVWALAQGGQPDGTVRRSEKRAWADRISRIVLLAAVARGWNPAAPVTAEVRIAAWLGGLVEVAMGPGFAMLDVRRGAPFLTTTRLQTLAALAALERERMPPPVTVQLLGTVDDVVAPADNVDLATGGGFYYVEVPRTNHLDIVEIEGREGEERRRLFRTALGGEPAEIAAVSVDRRVLADMVNDALDDHDLDHVDPDPDGGDGLPAPLRVRRGIRTVVFVVHGIRDYGYWTRKLAVRIKERARKAGKPCRTVTSSYGFFPMGPFLLKAERRKRAGWLMDQYVTARAFYPDADTFCFVGHSNGTYLLARALLDCPAVRFDHIVLAGSVVRPDYPWQELMRPGQEGKAQVGRVLNYVATADWVVASVPSALRRLRFPDLGDAGHVGFRAQPNVRNVEWVPGDHGAALQDQHWDEIAAFVLDGKDPESAPPDPAARRARLQVPWVAGLGRWAWAAVPAAAIGLCAAAIGLLSFLASVSLLAFSLGLLSLAWIASRVLTRV